MKIAVIVPVYNVEAYLGRCVESVLAQTHQDFDLILVDDGSLDRGGAICDEFALRDSRVHVLHQKNGGLSAARNAGLDWSMANSNCEWITFIDSDDWVHGRFLEMMLCGVQKDNADISVCEFLRVNEYVPDSADSLGEEDFSTMSPEEFWVWSMRSSPGGAFTSNVACAKLYRRTLFNHMRYPSEIRAHEDVHTTYKVVFAAKRIAVTPLRLYYYFSNPASITGGVWKPSRISAIRGGREQLEFFRRNGHALAFREGVVLHFQRLSWGLREARKPGFESALAELKQMAIQDYEEYRACADIPLDLAYPAVRLVRPIYANFFYPMSKMRGVVKRHGIGGTLRRIIRRKGK